MDALAATRSRALQTFIGLLPDGRCAVVRYWHPIDASLCGRCEKCTASPYAASMEVARARKYAFGLSTVPASMQSALVNPDATCGWAQREGGLA
jgi:hypothetical protein